MDNRSYLADKSLYAADCELWFRDSWFMFNNEPVKVVKFFNRQVVLENLDNHLLLCDKGELEPFPHISQYMFVGGKLIYVQQTGKRTFKKGLTASKLITSCVTVAPDVQIKRMSTEDCFNNLLRNSLQSTNVTQTFTQLYKTAHTIFQATDEEYYGQILSKRFAIQFFTPYIRQSIDKVACLLYCGVPVSLVTKHGKLTFTDSKQSIGTIVTKEIPHVELSF